MCRSPAFFAATVAVATLSARAIRQPGVRGRTEPISAVGLVFLKLGHRFYSAWSPEQR